MSHRNLVWILAVFLFVLLLWHAPDTVMRHRSFYNVFAPLADIRAQIHKNYVEDVQDEQLLEGAVQGMVQGLDPFSRYIPPDELETFNQQTSGMVPGIGIFLTVENGILKVISPVENSPAYKAGILPGDRIMGIDGEPTKTMSLFDAAARLRGQPGTTVVIEVEHELTETTERLTLQRAEVRIHSVKGYVRSPDGGWDYRIDPDQGIGYVRVTSFTEETPHELADVLVKLRSEPIKALIIDLRFNPGGLLQSAVDIANYFIDEGPIVSTKGKWAKPMVLNASSENTFPPVPMVVLVNQYSASAAEIVAGALKDHHRATLIGVRTFGKGSVQSVFPLDGGQGALKLTTAYYYLPSGRNIHRRANSDEWGVDPAIEIRLTGPELIELQQARAQADVLYTGEPNGEETAERPPVPVLIDRQLQRALELLRAQLAPATTPAATTAPAEKAS
ncbi:MAG: S41 family peptidase [Phycisphaerae bacterium]|nr:S41 family peptidase [Phycisphaerae bacterium]